MIALAAVLGRHWARAWLTAPLRAVDLLHLIRVGDTSIVAIRHRRH